MGKHIAKFSLASALAVVLATPAWAQESGGSDSGDIPVRAAEMVIPQDANWYETMKEELVARW